jgi:hypothetical protein
MTESGGSDLQHKSEIDVLKPPTPPTKVDDKAAALEESIEGQRVEFKRERFVYFFVIAVLFDALMLSVAPSRSAWFVVVASLVLLIGLAKWLQFPWVVAELEGWHNRIITAWHSKTNTKSEIEP